MKNLISFLGNAEYNVNLHVEETKLTRETYMYITVTTIDTVIGYKKPYTVIFNGLPTPKFLKKTCGKDVEAASIIIKTLKENEDVCKCVSRYWNFTKKEWEKNLDEIFNKYIGN